MHKYLLFITLLFSLNSFSQVIIHQTGYVFYFKGDSINNIKKESLAAKINKKMAAVRKKDKQFVYLDIVFRSDSNYYAVSFDNLYGDGIYNDVYNRKAWDYKNIALQLSAYTTTDKLNEEAIMKLLDYGISHRKKLLKQREREMRKDFYDREKPAMNIKRLEETLHLLEEQKTQF